MPKIGELSDPRPLTVPIGDGAVKIEVVYDRMAHTPKVAAEIARLENSPEKVDDPLVTMTTLTCRLLLSWDIQEDDGTPFPLEIERVAELGTVLLGAILEAIGEDSFPNPESGERSAATSPQEDGKGGSLTGTSS